MKALVKYYSESLLTVISQLPAPTPRLAIPCLRKARHITNRIHRKENMGLGCSYEQVDGRSVRQGN